MTTKLDYLAAKRRVDDRALNRHVWDRFVSALAADAEHQSDANHRSDARSRSDADHPPESDPIRILEVGAGIGTMIARLADWERLAAPVSYRAVDVDPACIAAARDRLPDWLADAGYHVDRSDDAIRAWATDDHRRASTPPQFEITLEVADATAIDADVDAIVAAALLDIVDLEATLAQLRDCLRPGGLLYAPCTFDGTTAFVPHQDLDDRIERLYHHHMDAVRDQPGSSRAGRALLETAPQLGYECLEAASSDWVVVPRDGGYRPGEAVVLEHLLETIGDALADYPDSVLETATRDRWIERRRTHLERAEFGAIVHQLDVLTRV